MRSLIPALVAVLVGVQSTAVTAVEPDPWTPVRPLIGRWEGTTSGQPGAGTVAREYSLVLRDRFIREVNTSRYPPQEKNPKGEVHEHVGMISYDKAAKTLVLRQFHGEGFVNTYRQVAAPPDSGTLIFVSEAFENLSAAWRARETYEFIGDDEFVETFELAPPGKPFEVYSSSRFKRVRQ